MKQSRASLNPRKSPRQERSRATLDAIMQAATYILVEAGWEAFTTNAIAERAGVNIGSLYQYFPNKEAILSELRERHVKETRQKLLTSLPLLSTQHSLHDALVLLVRALIEEHRIAPALHRAISEELPGSLKCSDVEDSFDEQLLQALTPFMKNVPDARLAIHIASIAVHAVIHETTCHEPGIFDRPELEGELVSLLEKYLQRPAK